MPKQPQSRPEQPCSKVHQREFIGVVLGTFGPSSSRAPTTAVPQAALCPRSCVVDVGRHQICQGMHKHSISMGFIISQLSCPMTMHNTARVNLCSVMTAVMTHRMLFCYGPLCDVCLCDIQTPTGSNHTPAPNPTSPSPPC